MKHNTLRLDIGSNEFAKDFVQLHLCITDRASKYSVTAGKVIDRASIKLLLKRIKSDAQYAAASHNSYAVRVSHEGVLYETKSDDGETGAGDIILRELRKADVTNVCVCVTRWFGGTKLMGDRFRHIQDATRAVLVLHE
jgi:putative IMPACT (imprinted ancient) family translation regulator